MQISLSGFSFVIVFFFSLFHLNICISSYPTTARRLLLYFQTLNILALPITTFSTHVSSFIVRQNLISTAKMISNLDQ